MSQLDSGGTGSSIGWVASWIVMLPSLWRGYVPTRGGSLMVWNATLAGVAPSGAAGHSRFAFVLAGGIRRTIRRVSGSGGSSS